MPEAGHVRISVIAPATTLQCSLEYQWAVDIYNVLAGRGIVSANAEFSAVADPNAILPDTRAMIDATPGYVGTLVTELQHMLNDVATQDVCEFISAMQQAGTPAEMEAAAWDLVYGVYRNITGDGRTDDDRFTCLDVLVLFPGQSDP